MLWSLLVLAAAVAGAPSAPKTSVTLLFENTLDFNEDASKLSALLVDPFTHSQASSACASFHETLLSTKTAKAFESDLANQLRYVALKNPAAREFYLSDGTVSLFGHSLAFSKLNPLTALFEKLPALCTQSDPASTVISSAATPQNRVNVSVGGNTFLGFRNKKTFRFMGIPYADPPARFEYTKVFSKTGLAIDATKFGSQCFQPGGVGDSEDCLFVNIQTPHIPAPGSKAGLLPVMFWIHGGGFTGGTGNDPTSDGANQASRSDIVVVTLNYRLSTLGFLAIPNTTVAGNFGLADQIVALDWVRAHISAFGGDPNKITIIGESAGAGSVRVLLGAPPAIGKFVGAVPMSNLGGVGYAATYSDYLTQEQSFAIAGEQIVSGMGCSTTASIEDQIACLKTADPGKMVNLATVARYPVQDGKIIPGERLDVIDRKLPTANVHTMWGIAEHDGASFNSPVPAGATTMVDALAGSLAVSTADAQSILDPGLFPNPGSGNITADAFNISARVSTDNKFRCIDMATVWSAVTHGIFKTSYFYEFTRTIGGFDPNGVGTPPATAQFPLGDPYLPYYRIHGADMRFMFATFGPDTNQPFREQGDLDTVRLATDTFGAFVRTLNPNPDPAFLAARVFTSGALLGGTWHDVKSGGQHNAIHLIDRVGQQTGFRELQQCAFLNFSINFYETGH